MRSTIALILLIPVAIAIGALIVIATTIVAFLLAVPLAWLGLDEVVGYVVLIFGLGGGLVLAFATFVVLYRRVPGRVRRFFGEDEPLNVPDPMRPSEPLPVLGRDPHADPPTLEERIHHLDESLRAPDTEIEHDETPRT